MYQGRGQMKKGDKSRNKLHIGVIRSQNSSNVLTPQSLAIFSHRGLPVFVREEESNELKGVAVHKGKC